MRAADPSAQRDRRSLRVKLWLKILVSALLLALILFKVPWQSLWSEASRLDPGLWLGVFAAFLAGHSIGVFKWRFNVNLGNARLGAVDAVQCYSAGLFANLCLPSIVGGDALKAWLAGKVTGRLEAAVLGGLTERLLDTAALLCLLIVGGLLSHATVEGWASQTILVGSLVGLAGLAIFLPLLLRVRLKRWPRRLRRPAGRSMVAMRRLISRPQLALAIFALSILIQGWFVLLNAWLGRGLGIEVPLAFWFLAIPLAKAITLAPISLGGFGVREVALAGILALAGVPKEQGVVVSLLWQSILVASGLCGGLIWFALGFRSSARTGGGHGSLLAEARARVVAPSPLKSSTTDSRR
jgi:glycosyltransferase 2 family protein